MLKYLKFYIGSFFGSAVSVNVRIKRKRVFYSVDFDMPYKAGVSNVPLSEKNSAAWLSRLGKIRLDSWRSDYTDNDILDGTYWSLKYKEDGVSRRICGSNEYPSNWDDFIETMDALVPEAKLISGDRLDSLKICYRRLSFDDGRCTARPYETRPKLCRNYNEYLYIDRKSQRLIYKINIGTNCMVKHEYYPRGGVTDLLDWCSDFLAGLGGGNDLEPNEDTPSLTVELAHHNGKNRFFAYNRDLAAFTKKWRKLMDKLKQFLSSYGQYAFLLDTELLKCKIGAAEYIYCSVEFTPGAKRYHYRTEDRSLKLGDRIIVPVGENGSESVAVIKGIEYFTADRLPYPLDKTKAIIRKL